MFKIMIQFYNKKRRKKEVGRAITIRRTSISGLFIQFFSFFKLRVSKVQFE